jgi:Ni/Co efflux regulator RcnB
MKRLQVVLAVLALAVPASEGVAKDKGKGKDKGKAVKVEKNKGSKVVVATDTAHGRRVVFVHADRQAARNWWRQTYGRDCPPGLAKKNNGCLPPGQAKKRYVVGQRLPTTIVIGSVPASLRLSAAPTGYRYAYLDGDILLIDAASRLVADVIINALD